MCSLWQERIIAMEELMEDVGDRMAMLINKPSTRVQACQLLAKTKVLFSVTKYYSASKLELVAVGSPEGG